VQGKEEFELYVKHQRFRFYGQNELNFFKKNLELFFSNEVIEVPPPRIMVIGIRGSGMHTQLKLLNEKFNIPTLDLKSHLLKRLALEKEKRKTQRALERGFKAPEYDEEG